MEIKPILKPYQKSKSQYLSLMLTVFSALLIFGPTVQASEWKANVINGDYEDSFPLLNIESNASVNNFPAFSLQKNHANVLNTDLFYNYKLSSYRSDESVQDYTQNSALLNPVKRGASSFGNNTKNWQGIDAQVTLGYDIVKKSSKDYFGVGFSVGMSLPYDNKDALNTTKANVSNVNSNNLDLLSGETEISGQQLGPKLIFGKSFGDLTSVYGEVSYARQNMQVKNSALDVSSNINGDYFSYEVGMRYQPFADKKDFGLITLEPSLYFTLGVNYSELKMDKFQVDLQEGNGQLEPIKLDASSTQLNFGVDYLF